MSLIEDSQGLLSYKLRAGVSDHDLLFSLQGESIQTAEHNQIGFPLHQEGLETEPSVKNHPKGKAARKTGELCDLFQAVCPPKLMISLCLREPMLREEALLKLFESDCMADQSTVMRN